MLVLTRRKDESIVFPGLGVIDILSVKGNRVRIGLNFNDDIVIQRGELPIPETQNRAESAHSETATTETI